MSAFATSPILLKRNFSCVLDHNQQQVYAAKNLPKFVWISTQLTLLFKNGLCNETAKQYFDRLLYLQNWTVLTGDTVCHVNCWKCYFLACLQLFLDDIFNSLDINKENQLTGRTIKRSGNDNVHETSSMWYWLSQIYKSSYFLFNLFIAPFCLLSVMLFFLPSHQVLFS